jgi:hypothetical protein
MWSIVAREPFPAGEGSEAAPPDVVRQLGGVRRGELPKHKVAAAARPNQIATLAVEIGDGLHTLGFGKPRVPKRVTTALSQDEPDLLRAVTDDPGCKRGV